MCLISKWLDPSEDSIPPSFDPSPLPLPSWYDSWPGWSNSSIWCIPWSERSANFFSFSCLISKLAASLSDFVPNETVIIDQRYASFVEDSNYNIDGSSIGLDIYKPNYLKYTSQTQFPALAVFSEIYYKDGWNVYIDGKKSDYFRANYVLRAMEVPAGNHTIEFKFEPKVYKIGEGISLASSIILILLLVFVSFKELKQEWKRF